MCVTPRLSVTERASHPAHFISVAGRGVRWTKPRLIVTENVLAGREAVPSPSKLTRYQEEPYIHYIKLKHSSTCWTCQSIKVENERSRTEVLHLASGRRKLCHRREIPQMAQRSRPRIRGSHSWAVCGSRYASQGTRSNYRPTFSRDDLSDYLCAKGLGQILVRRRR